MLVERSTNPQVAIEVIKVHEEAGWLSEDGQDILSHMNSHAAVPVDMRLG